MARRRIPDRGMPHQASIRPCTGWGQKGPTYGQPFAVRGNFNGAMGARRAGQVLAVQSGSESVSITLSGELVTDDVPVGVLSQVTNLATGNTQVVAAVTRFDQPPVQPFLVLLLGSTLA